MAAKRKAADAETLRIRRVLRGLRKEYPDPECALIHETPFQLLIATILSAQCTDERVNMVTKELFAKWPDAASLADVPIDVLEQEVRSTGFYRNKAKNVRATSIAIRDEHQGNVPQNMDELLQLPGVARKTANVVLGTAFGIAVGVVVDTHVGRLSNRLGMTEAHGKDAIKIERDLMQVVPKKDWVWLAHALIWHGRKVCSARTNPACGECSLAQDCPSAGQFA